MPNPYNYSTVVTDPSRFFGREAALEDLCTRLRNMQSTSVVGLRRVGKSSLLYQLACTLSNKLGQDYVPVYISLQDARCRTVADFVKTIVTKLNERLGGIVGGHPIGVTLQQGALQQDYLVRLRQILDKSFNRDELRTLSFDLSVDYDNLPGEGKVSKARELISYLERRDRISELVRIGKKRRPNISWEYVSEVTKEAPSRSQSTPIGRLREALKAKRLRGVTTVSSVTGMPSFSEMLEKLDHAGIRLVVCLDEFEEFMRHPEEFTDGFLEALRALGEQSKLAIVTASRTPLVDLIRAGQLTSPFYNIFSQIELGLLEAEAAQELRRAPFAWEGIVPSLEHEALIKELGGRHPCFLQMACYHLYEALHQPQFPQADVVEVVRGHFERDAEPHFGWLCDHLSADEKAALRAVVGYGFITQDTRRVLGRLTRLGVVEQVDGGWQAFSGAFTRHVKQSLPSRTQFLWRLFRPRGS
jgi:hypothetical protein